MCSEPLPNWKQFSANKQVAFAVSDAICAGYFTERLNHQSASHDAAEEAPPFWGRERKCHSYELAKRSNRGQDVRLDYDCPSGRVLKALQRDREAMGRLLLTSSYLIIRSGYLPLRRRDAKRLLHRKKKLENELKALREQIYCSRARDDDDAWDQASFLEGAYLETVDEFCIREKIVGIERIAFKSLPDLENSSGYTVASRAIAFMIVDVLIDLLDISDTSSLPAAVSYEVLSCLFEDVFPCREGRRSAEKEGERLRGRTTIIFDELCGDPSPRQQTHPRHPSMERACRAILQAWPAEDAQSVYLS